jgi:hypothetical protein
MRSTHNPIRLIGLWLNKYAQDGFEIRADFADDWHVRSDIYPPHDAESVAKALRFLAAMVEHHYSQETVKPQTRKLT